MSLERGGSLGSYRLLFRLGSGGMGEVWKARDTGTGRDVAIKVLNPGAAGDPDRLARFVMEAKAASSLQHPNILAIHEVGESSAGPYIVMEYVDGDTVRSLLSSGSLPLSQAVNIVTQAADGVAHAHARGIVHRDLKPENLMVARNGSVKILDFGLAKLLHPEGSGDTARTAAGMVVGSAGYLSPEQLRGEKASERSDVFSLGVVFYEMATGANPFQRNSAVETFSAILSDPPEPLVRRAPEAPEELVRVVERALAKKPEERQASAGELAAQLRAAGSGLVGKAAADDAVVVPVAAGTRRVGWLALGSAFLVAVAALLLLRGC
jgi:eukaryotic-like serine/threonine-protein kinase